MFILLGVNMEQQKTLYCTLTTAIEGYKMRPCHVLVNVWRIGSVYERPVGLTFYARGFEGHASCVHLF